MRDEVFRELSDGARQQQRAQKLVLEQPAEHIFKAVSRPGRTSAVIGIKRMRKHEAEWYRVRIKSERISCVSDTKFRGAFFIALIP